MGIDIDDIEFHLRWNWNSRSSQWGWTRWLTVSDYYSMFCHWKDDMESHGCPAEEGDYIDAFLENLRQELRSKVIHHRSQMSSLADALFYAKGEEMTMNIDDKLEAFRLNRARFSHEFEASEVFDKIPRRDAQKEFSSVTPPKVFDNLPDRIRVSPKELPPTDSQSVPEKCYSFSAIEEVELSSLKAGIQLMERPAELFPSRLDVPKVAYQVFEEMSEPVPTIQHSSSKGCLFPNMADEQLVDEVRQPPLLKMNCLKAGRHLFDEIPERFAVQRNTDKNVVLPTSGLLKILSYEEAASEFQSVKLEGSKSPEHVFDKMLQQFSVKQKNKINGYEKWKPSMVDFPGDLDSKADKMKVGSTNSSSKMMFGEMGVFMFDPGISSWLRKGCGFTKSNGVKHNFGKMPSNLNVELWVGKVLVFVFDPGGFVLPSVVPHAAFCSNILRNGGNEELCNETIDETIENSVKLFFYIYDKQGNDQFMSKTKWMVIQFGMVCCVTYSSTNCRSMSEYMKLLCTRESPMGGIGYDCIQHLIDRSAGSIDIICRGWMGYVFAILFAPLALSWLLMRLISSGVKSRDTRHLSSRIVQRLQPGLLTCWKLLEGNQRQSYMNLALIIVGEFQRITLIITTEVHDYFVIPSTRKCIQWWAKVSPKSVGELKAIASRDFYAKGKSIDPWRHFLDDRVLPSIFENAIWDPGVSHFTTLRTRRLLRGRICHDPSLLIRVLSLTYVQPELSLI